MLTNIKMGEYLEKLCEIVGLVFKVKKVFEMFENHI
jgi:hypothetical protein